MIKLLIDLTGKTATENTEDGLQVAMEYFQGKIISRNIVIACVETQTISYQFWKGLLGSRYSGLNGVGFLFLKGFNNETVMNLAKYMHEKDIRPKKLSLNGEFI